MNKKILLKYILMYIPMVLGIVLFSNNVINIFSSLLLFLGGYVAIKNTFDYRYIKKNINSVKEQKVNSNNLTLKMVDSSEKVLVKSFDSVEIKPKNPENIVGFKRTRRYTRVRRRY